MKSKSRNLSLSLLLVALGAGGYALWQHVTLTPGSSTARKVLVYQDSMHPWVKSDQPGKCTICAMELTPIYEGEQGFGNTANLVTLSSNNVTVLNVQTDEVKRRPLNRTIRVAGVLEADTTRKTILAAPAPGRIDNVKVASAGVDVQAGQVLATIYSPDLAFQTRRYIFRDRLTEPTNSSMAASAEMAGSSRHRPNPVVSTRGQPLPARERVEADPYYNDLLSTQTGTVTERNVFDGQYVAEGDRLFTIVDCSVLWFRFDAYEHQLPWLEPGQAVEVTVPSIPGQVFPAVISVIEPTLDETTRTAKVRADVTNPPIGKPGHQRRQLHLGMYADGRLRAQVPEVLAVPREAVLFPGGQAYAYLDKGGGAYEMRRVTLGRQGDDHWEILRGLNEGDRVVTSGNVMIDAQAQFNRGTAPGDADAVQVASADHGQVHAGHASPDETGDPGADSPGGAAPELTGAQHQALAGFLAVADGISATLAADNLDQLKPYVAKLTTVAEALSTAFPADHPWHTVVQRIQTTSRWPTPANLEAARKAFLPFSTNAVELVQRLRSEEAAFASTKVFFCPMAPKPGLWFQARGPLRNPYYGARMLTCGEEVPPPASVAKTTTRTATEPAPSTAPRPVPTAHEPAVAPTAAKGPQSQTSGRRGIAGYEQAATSLSARFAQMSRSVSNAPVAPKPEPGTAGPKPTDQPHVAVGTFVTVADGISQALAADNLEQYQERLARLPDALAALERDYTAQPRVSALVRKLTALTQGAPPASLEDARKRFLPFSSNAVELAKLLKQEVSSLDGLKIYHCPMAPQPGVWLQAKGPLRNPFYGSKMLTCGEEVKL